MFQIFTEGSCSNCTHSASFSIVYHHEYARKIHNGFLLMSFKYPLGQWVLHYARLWFKRDLYIYSKLRECFLFLWYTIEFIAVFNGTALKFPIFWPWNTKLHFLLTCPLTNVHHAWRIEFGHQTEWTAWNVIESFRVWEIYYNCF